MKSAEVRACGSRLANGVYLYLVQAKGYDGQVLRIEVRKLVVKR